MDSFKLPISGTYAIVIAPQTGAGSATATAFVFDDLKAAILPNSSHSFSTSIPGQNATFSFSGNAGQQVNAWLTNNTYSGCYSAAITILKPDGSQLTSANACGPNNVGLALVSLPTVGTYTVVADPQGTNLGGGTLVLSADQIGTIATNTSVPVNISVPGQNAQYTFSGTAGQSINVGFTNSTFSGCRSVALSVLKPDGSQLASDFSCGTDNVDLALLKLPLAGTYTVIVASQNANTGTGTLTLSTDQLGTITVGNSIPVNIAIPGQNAQYTFSGTAGQSINAVLTNSTFSGCRAVALTLLKPDGSQLAFGFACGTDSVDLALNTLPVTGTYTIIVASQHANTGTGTLTLSADQLGTITVGNSIPVNIAIPGQNAQYTFSGTAGQSINVALTNSTFSGCRAVALTLLKPDGSQLAFGFACGTDSVGLALNTLPVTGTYTIVVASQNGNTGTGTLTLSTDQLGTITVGNSIPVNIAIPGQNAQYTFSGTAGQSINVVLTNSTFSGCRAVALTLLKPDGSQLAFGFACGTDSVDLALNTLPVTGTYTIVVASQNGNTGTGTLTLSTDQLGTITVGNSIPVNIAIPGQNAQYTFSGTIGQSLNIAFTASTFSGCRAVAVSILNPDGSQLAYGFACGSDDVHLNALTLPAVGVYIVIVATQNGNTGGGSLLVY